LQAASAPWPSPPSAPWPCIYNYAHVLLGPGFEAALGQHTLWGVLLLFLVAFGPGRVSVDAWLQGRGTEPLPGGVAPGGRRAAL
jgi:hypothetical protein